MQRTSQLSSDALIAFRTALEFPIGTELRLLVIGNLGALLMASSNMHGALEVLDQGIKIVRNAGIDAASVGIQMFVVCLYYCYILPTPAVQMCFSDSGKQGIVCN